MKAILFSYSSGNLDKNEASKLSKRLIGYLDKSNNSRYEYKREGLIKSNNGIVVSRSTFIIPKKREDILKKLKKKGVEIREWEISIPKYYFLN